VTGTAVDGLRETHARIGQDTSLSSMQWLAPTDGPAAALPIGSNFRVRFQVWNDGAAAQAWHPRLEWAAVAASMTWAAVPTSAGGAPLFTTATNQYANGTAIPVASFALGPGPTGTIAQAGVAYAGSNPGGSFSLNGSSYTEIEFNVQPTSAAAFAKPYAFRLTDNGTLLTSSAIDGQVSVRAPQNPLSPHVTVGQTPDNCAACHRSHTGQGPMLQKLSDDKQVCLSCHDGTGAQPSLSGEFSAASPSALPTPFTVPMRA
jgi:predicted CXXCH cytochrome family protein